MTKNKGKKVYLWDCKKEKSQVTFEKCIACSDCGPITDLPQGGRHRLCFYGREKFSPSKKALDWKDVFEDIEVYEQAEKERQEKDRRLIEKALEVAKKAHKGQLRDEGTPYIEHVIRVSERALSYLPESYVKIIGLLHDTLEDSKDFTEENIRDNFGNLIADSVVLLTRPEGQPRSEYIKKVFETDDFYAHIVKVSDRIDNLESLKYCPNQAKIKKYLQETKEVFLPEVEKKKGESYKEMTIMLHDVLLDLDSFIARGGLGRRPQSGEEKTFSEG